MNQSHFEVPTFDPFNSISVWIGLTLLRLKKMNKWINIYIYMYRPLSNPLNGAYPPVIKHGVRWIVPSKPSFSSGTSQLLKDPLLRPVTPKRITNKATRRLVGLMVDRPLGCYLWNHIQYIVVCIRCATDVYLYYVCILCIKINIYKYIYIYVYTYTYVYVYTYIHTYIYIYTCKYVYIYIYIHTCIYIYKHM